jgi:hypothetical protein
LKNTFAWPTMLFMAEVPPRRLLMLSVSDMVFPAPACGRFWDIELGTKKTARQQRPLGEIDGRFPWSLAFRPSR